MKRPNLTAVSKFIEHKAPVARAIDCLNCGNAIEGSYCCFCGQRTDVQRYTFRGLWSDIFEQFKKLDGSAVFRTFWELAVRPGTFVREYLLGKRVGFIGPIRLFFYSFVLQVSVGLVFHELTGMDSNFLTDGADFSSQVVDLFSVIFWGLLWVVIFKRSGLNTAENVVAAIYFTSGSFLLTLLLRFIIGPFLTASPNADTIFVVIDLVAYLAYSFYFTHHLFRESGLKFALKQLVLVVLYAIIVVTLVFAMFLGKAVESELPASAI